MSLITPKRQTTGISYKDDIIACSSHPRSTPYQESHDDMPPPSSSTHVRASIASTPQAKLREVLLRLVDRNPEFQLAVARELLASAPERFPTSPRRKRRRSGRRSLHVRTTEHPCVKCGKPISDDAVAEACHYHP
ncbi:hypothetical protein C0992_011223, partial [Termitomyces sp. T32_za158]